MNQLTTEIEKREDGHLYTLDALKYFASVIIIFHHYQQATGILFPRFNFFGGRIYFGYIVELFFMISGFLTWNHIDRDETTPFSQFALHKILRLCPVPILSIVVTTLALWLFRMTQGQWYGDSVVGLWKFFQNVTLTFSGGGGILDSIGINNPLWFICVLLICNFFYWLVLKISSRLKISRLWFFVGLMYLGMCSIYGVIPFPLFYSQSGRGYLAFFGGIVLHSLFQYLQNRVSRNTIRNISFAILCFCLAAWFALGTEVYDDMQKILVFIVYPALIFFVFTSKLMCWVLNRKVFGFLGKISFEMYIWHSPVFTFSRLLVFLSGYRPNYTYVSMIIFAVLMTFLSIGMYFLVERPITKKLREIEQKRLDVSPNSKAGNQYAAFT